MPTDSELVRLADPTLDQHFLVSETKLARLIDAADIRPTDHVIELGAGAGTVARALPTSASLTLIEFDERLGELLRQNVPGARILHGDALNLIRQLPCDVLIANLPHWVTENLVKILPDLPFRTAIIAVGQEPSLEQLGSAFTWEKVESITGDDFLPPQEGVSYLMKVVRNLEKTS